MGHVEAKIFADNQDEEVASELPSVWGLIHSEVPWKLPVVTPSSERKSAEVHDNVVEDAADHSLFNKLSPGYCIGLPWPWGILFDFILFKESVLSSVNEPVKSIQCQNGCDSHCAHIKCEKLCLCKFITLW